MYLFLKLWQFSKCFGLIGAATLLLPVIASASDLKSEGYSRCNDWLSEHYRAHHRTEVIDAYVQRGIYNLVANFEVVTSLGERATVGFECKYISDQDRVVGQPSLTTFPKRDPKSEVVRGMKEYRVEFGFHVCPSIVPWKRMADQIVERDRRLQLARQDGTNLSGEEMVAMVSDLPTSCDWISEGDTVYGPPIKKETYKKWSYVQIRLRDGRIVWAEDGNLRE